MTECTGAGTWEDPEVAIHISMDGRLIVSQSERVHREIADLLDRMRRRY